MRRDRARDDRRAVRGGLEQRERESLQRRRQHEGRGVRVELLERLPVHVARHEHPRVAPRLPVRASRTKSSVKLEPPAITSRTSPGTSRNAPTKRSGAFSGTSLPTNKHVGAAGEAPSLGDRRGIAVGPGFDAVRDAPPCSAGTSRPVRARRGRARPRSSRRGRERRATRRSAARDGPRRPTSPAPRPGHGWSGRPSHATRYRGRNEGRPGPIAW